MKAICPNCGEVRDLLSAYKSLEVVIPCSPECARNIKEIARKIVELEKPYYEMQLQNPS